jgi:hypothetical protein
MKNRALNLPLAAIIVMMVLSSCEKVIDIDLNSKSSKIVIEGIIDDQPGPYYIRLSTTVTFDEVNDFPPVSGARVIITDDQAGNDTLLEISPGLYQTTSLQGIYGHTYTLQVNTPSGESYSSVCKMPALVPYDSLMVDSLFFFGASNITFTPYYIDPITLGNRYRFIVYRNNKLVEEAFVFEDRFNNGLMNSRPIIVGEEWETGDSARIIKQDIDQGVYDYFNSLQLSSDGQTASPANPTSNISNGALGYFSVHTSQSKTVAVP